MRQHHTVFGVIAGPSFHISLMLAAQKLLAHSYCSWHLFLEIPCHVALNISVQMEGKQKLTTQANTHITMLALFQSVFLAIFTLDPDGTNTQIGTSLG